MAVLVGLAVLEVVVLVIVVLLLQETLEEMVVPHQFQKDLLEVIMHLTKVELVAVVLL
tara:strand:- start:112 stop:285 length:174 start_codon:yes stop_codon:yes gene_type:complete